MYLPKPIYEALPYLYLLMGVLFIAGAAYISYWYTGAPVYTFFGYFCVVAGLVLGLRRYAFRRQARKRAQEAEDAGPVNAN